MSSIKLLQITYRPTANHTHCRTYNESQIRIACVQKTRVDIFMLQPNNPTVLQRQYFADEPGSVSDIHCRVAWSLHNYWQILLVPWTIVNYVLEVKRHHHLVGNKSFSQSISVNHAYQLQKALLSEADKHV